MNQLIARVLIAVHTQSLDRLFDYLVPASMSVNIQKGARVIVPFQNRASLAYVWELTDVSEVTALKEIQQIIDDPPLISWYHYQLIDWMAEYYFCSRIDILKLCLPPGAHLAQKSSYQLTIDQEQLRQQLKEAFFLENEIDQALQLIKNGTAANWNISKWQKEFLPWTVIWEYILKNKFLKKSATISKAKVNPKTHKVYFWVNDPSTNEIKVTKPETPAGERIRTVLSENSTGLSLLELMNTAAVSASVIQRLLKQGQIYCQPIHDERVPIGFSETAASREICFSEQQHAINEQIWNDQTKKPFLLHGITGSGKTEIYFEIAARMLETGNQVLYLVPEIALTPQTLKRARSRFGDQVALLHSNMSDGERYDQWFKIKHRQANFVLGSPIGAFWAFREIGFGDCG